VQVGALQMKPRVCYTRPATESTATDGFVEVSEVTLQGDVKRIFSGWMFAASPGLHAVEHPIYDVWLTGCKGGSTVVADTGAPGPTQATGSSGTGKPAAGQQRAAAPPGTAPAGATAAAPAAPTRQAPARQPTAPQAQPAPDSLQPLPPPPGSTPVQWPPRR
ncbi:MAG: DUF2155 domain-containing protein, partial [Xanthobacteraceae bacterium]|nr:DUF2155 domain-containing protein [Xanthobacteraceae bacterium]